MGILSRFITVVRANLNTLLDRAEDPTKMLEQTLRDMEGAYRKAKDQVAHSVADEKRLEKSLLDQQAQNDGGSHQAGECCHPGQGYRQGGVAPAQEGKNVGHCSPRNGRDQRLPYRDPGIEFQPP